MWWAQEFPPGTSVCLFQVNWMVQKMCRRRKDLGCSLHEFKGVNEKFSSHHLHGGKKKNLILVTSCHAQELFFEKVSKLVKIFLGVSLVFLEKLKRQKVKSKNPWLHLAFSFHVWNIYNIKERDEILFCRDKCSPAFVCDAILNYGFFIPPLWLFDFFSSMEAQSKQASY